ncbi:MAG: methyltransferase domain-containing protein [Kiritimatiellae bacterium]|nr:methyltransferase domain-containing protein [Kiritimatiellia bacterium]
MKKQIDWLQEYNMSSKRDYVGRVTAFDKGECAAIAKKWGQEYWDGPRQYGFGGYKYDGRWLPFAQKLAKHYGIKPGHKILDVGCGKGFLLHEFTRAVPGVEVAGLDISQYGIDNAKEEVKPFLTVGHCRQLPYPDKHFDFVYSNTTLHNLQPQDLYPAIKEIERVRKGEAWIGVESYRNEKEKANLLYWQLTCEAFFSPDGWRWWFDHCGYQGDYGFIYFE